MKLNKKNKIFLVLGLFLTLVTISVLIFIFTNSQYRKHKFVFNKNTYQISYKKDLKFEAKDNEFLRLETLDSYSFNIIEKTLPPDSNKQDILNYLITVQGYYEIPFDDKNYEYIFSIEGIDVYMYKDFKQTSDEDKYYDFRLFFRSGNNLSNIYIDYNNLFFTQILVQLPKALTSNEVSKESVNELKEAFKSIKNAE